MQEAVVRQRQYTKMLLKAKAYRTQAVQLQAQLRRMTNKVMKLSKVRAGVARTRICAGVADRCKCRMGVL